jgi:hypothetical protein
VIAYAKTKGIYVFMYIDYLGGNDAEAWRTHTAASTTTQMEAWGNTMGSRYKDSTNVLWIVGGDTDPTSYQTKLDAMVAGLIASGATQLIGTRDEYPTTGDTHWATRTWWKINGNYQYWGTSPYNELWTQAKNMRGRLHSRPSGVLEATFENENGWTGLIGRAQSFYSILGGSLGYQTTGNCPIWHFNTVNSGQCGYGTTWTNWLNTTNFTNQTAFWKITQRNRNWWKFIPDTSNIVLTAGQSSGTDMAVCSITSDSTSILVYMPTDRQVTINTNYMRARVTDSVHVSWFNPATGDSTSGATLARTSSQVLNPPSAGEWVLALDAKQTEYSPKYNGNLIIRKP